MSRKIGPAAQYPTESRGGVNLISSVVGHRPTVVTKSFLGRRLFPFRTWLAFWDCLDARRTPSTVHQPAPLVSRRFRNSPVQAGRPAGRPFKYIQKVKEGGGPGPSLARSGKIGRPCLGKGREEKQRCRATSFSGWCRNRSGRPPDEICPASLCM